MAKNSILKLPEFISRHQQELLEDWLKKMASSGVRRDDLMKEGELREQANAFLKALVDATHADGEMDTSKSAWASMRDLLASVSRTRAVQGFSPAQTAMFVFSFKEPLFERLRSELAGDAEALAEQTWTANVMIDRLGLFTVELFQKSREEIIARQQQDMLELSTPVVKLWEGVLALPLIGTLDSARTQVVMESLLQRIVETGASVAIIDITGVPTVDTLVAQHLLKTVTAARLMGADCIISGIRPQIAQTIVHLGVDLMDVTTKASLADAFAMALRRLGLRVERAAAAPGKRGGEQGAGPGTRGRDAGGSFAWDRE